MNRRQAVQRVALLVGGTVLGAEMFIQTGCKTSTKKVGADAAKGALPDFFTTDEIAYLDEIAETILPRTATPGAKDAKVGEFMHVMVRDCYSPTDQKTFKAGLTNLETLSKEKYKNGFLQITPEQRKELLIDLDKAAEEYTKTPAYKSEKDALTKQENTADSLQKSKFNFGYDKKTMPKHYFSMMKQLTLLGFFTSEPGATKALRYVAIPGKYDPCMPYAKGDRAWAT